MENINQNLNWQEIRIYTTHEGVEPLTNALIAAGIDGLLVNDPEDIREFERNKNDSWDYIGDEVWELCGKDTYIGVYVLEGDLAQSEAIMSAVAGIKDLPNMGSLEIRTNDLSGEDWANSWKRFWKPMEIGEKLVVVPSWEQAPEGNRAVISLDPENSFGTGRHHTTRLCLELTEKYVSDGDSICDLGCGSGIISIAGMLLGGKFASAVDISNDAVDTAGVNAEKNGIARKDYRTFCGDVAKDEKLLGEIYSLSDGGYEIVAANIVADVLLSMSRSVVFEKLTKKGGKLLLSGIIDGRVDEVVSDVASGGFELLEQKSCEMWNAAAFVRV